MSQAKDDLLMIVVHPLPDLFSVWSVESQIDGFLKEVNWLKRS